MKKTIVLVAAALVLAGTGVDAKTNGNNLEKTNTTALPVVEGINSFCKAIMQGDIATVKSLIALGENVNQKSLGMTPAIFAARYNQAEILELLIENGANLSLKSDKGRTIKEYAQLSNATEALEVIEKNGKK